MGGLNSGPGPGITLLIAIVLVLAQIASSAPLYEEDEGQENNSQSLAESHGCYYNFQHYNEGERILTNEPCLNCTCRNRMLMCYLRVCPFTKGIGQNCTVEKVPGQCCPIITCPEVPVQLLTSTTTEGIKAPGGHHGTKGTTVGHLDTNGCNIDGIFYPNGAQVPGSPEKPCELCYCIRNKTACIMQECALHVDGCRPVYEEGQCFPVRYQCDDTTYEEELTTTIRPAPTPGLIITTTSAEPLDCTYNNEVYEDGSRIQTEDPCEHCYCLKGKIACAVQECGAPLEKEGQNCTALPPAQGKCCPDSYQCDVTMTSQELNNGSEGTTEAGISSEADVGHPTNGYHPDQGIRTTEKPSHLGTPLDHTAETGTPSKNVEEQKPAKAKPQELDRETQNELIENHLQGLHPTKATSDDNQNIAFPVDKNEDTKVAEITPEKGRPETTHIKGSESYDHMTDDHTVDTSSKKKQPHPESISHTLGVSEKGPETATPIDHSEGTVIPPFDLSGVHSTHSQGQIPSDSTTNTVLSLKPQTPASDVKDPLLDKLHNIIQDVQAQVSDGKTTGMPEEVDYQSTMQSQTGHFTDRPEILSHLPQLGSQTSSSGSIEMGSTANGTLPDDSNDIINKLQGIIQGIYSHVTDTIISTRIPESSTMAGQTQSNIPIGNSEIIRPDGTSELESPIPEKEDLKPHKESEHPVHRPHDTETTGELVKDKYPSKKTPEKLQPEIMGTDHSVTTGKIDEIQSTQHPDISERPQDSKYSTETLFGSHITEYPERTSVTGLSEDLSGKHPEKPAGITPENKIKLPLGPKPEGSYDEPYGAKYPEMTNNAEKEVLIAEHPFVTNRPDQIKYPQGINNYLEKIKPGQQHLEGINLTPQYPDHIRPVGQYSDKIKPTDFIDEIVGAEHVETTTVKLESETEYSASIRPSGQYPGGFTSGQSSEIKPTGIYPEESKPTGQYPEGVKPSGQHPEKINPTEFEGYKPGQQHPDGSRLPTGQHPDGIIPSEEYPEEHKPIKQYPEGSKPMEYYPENTSNTSFQISYSKNITGKPDDENKYPENVESVPLGQYPEKAKPTDRFPSGSVKPTGTKPLESDSKYPEGYKPGQKPLESYPEGSKYPETIEITGRPEDQTNYPESFAPVTRYPEGYKPNEHFEGSKDPFDKNKLHSSTESDDFSTENPNETEAHSRPKPESNMKPSGIQYPQITERPDISSDTEVTDSLVTLTEKTKPEEMPHKNEQSEEVTGKPDDGSKYIEHVKPEGIHPEDFKFPVTGKPENSKRPYSSEHPEVNGITNKPEKESKYPEGFRPTDESPHRPTPESEDEFYGSEYLGTTEKSDFSFESTTYTYSDKSSTTQKTEIADHSNNLKPTEHYSEDSKTFRPQEQSKYPQKLGVENKPYGSGSSDSTDMPDEQYTTENPDYNSIIKKPENEDNFHGIEHTEKVIKKPSDENSYPEKQKIKDELPDGKYQTGKPEGTSESAEKITSAGKPQVDNKYSQRPETEVSNVTDQSHKGSPAVSQRPTVPEEQPQRKPESGNEAYGTQYPEGPKVPSVLDSDYKSHGTEYPEGQTDKPVDSIKYPDENKEQINRPQKPESQHFHESSAEQPDEENSEQSTTIKPQGFPKYSEETYVSQHPEKIIPSSEDQLLEVHTKPEGFGNYSEKTKPLIEPIKTDKPLDETKHSEKYKPSSMAESVTRPSASYKPDISGHPEQSEKPMGIYESLEGSTKTPHYTTLHPQKSSDRPSDSEHSEETGKPQYTKVSEYTEKIKPYSTEYPERTRPNEASEYASQTERPQDLNEYPVKSKPETLDKPKDQVKYPTTADFESATDKSEDKQKYPTETEEGMEHTKVSGTDRPLQINVPEGGEGKPEYSGQKPEIHIPSESEKLATTYSPDEESKNPQTFINDTEIRTGRPEDFNKYSDGSKPIEEEHPQGTEHPEQPGKPEYESKYPESFIITEEYTQRPYGSQPFPVNEYSDNKVTGKPEHDTKFSEGNEVEHYPGLTKRPQYSTKYPEGEKLHDPELSHGTEFPIDTPEYHTEYPDKFIPMGIHSEADNKPQQSNEYSESGTQHPEATTDRMDDYTKYQETVTGVLPEHVKYPEKPKPVEHYSGATESLQGFTKYPESEESFNTKYPESGLNETSENLTKQPANLKPGGFYPEQLQVSEENPDLSTEYPNIRETDRPELSTKYSEEDKAHETEFPANIGITQEQSLTENSEGTDSFYGTEHTNLSTVSNEYIEKFKPGSSHPESLTEHPLEEKPTGIYSHGNERPEEEEAFENGVTVSTDAVTKLSDNKKPVGSETTVYGIEFPEKVTDKPENVKHSEETGTKYSETNTGEPVKENIHPEESISTAKYPHGLFKNGSKPESEHGTETYGTEHPEMVSTSEDQIGFTKYPYESSTIKHLQGPELGGIEGFGQPGDLSKYPYGFKPDSGNYPEHLGVTGRPQSSTNYPQKKPLLENKPSKNQYDDETDQPESSTLFPDGKKPEVFEAVGTVITDKPEKSKYPDDSKYSEITKPDVKHPQRPKPAASYDTPYGTAYPETTDAEDDIGTTKTSEYLGQHPIDQYPKRPKPTGFGEKLHSTENSNDITDQPEGTSLYSGMNNSSVKYPPSPKPGSEDASLGEEHTQGTGFTKKPDDESKYSEKTEYFTSRPFSVQAPDTTGSDQSFVTEYPNVAGQAGSSSHPKKPQPGFEDEHYSNIYLETTTKLLSEDELHATEYTGESDKLSHGFRPTDRPYETEYPGASESNVSGPTYTSTKYPEAVEELEITTHPDETDTSEKSPEFHLQDSKKPQETASSDVNGTEKYPGGFKPIGEYPQPSERPHVPSKHPVKAKPSVSDGGIHGAGHSGITKKPEDELFGTQYPKETENTVRPEYEERPENTEVHVKPHGIHRYPLRPKPISFEDEPFGTEYSETTEELDETSTIHEENAFSRNPIILKPVTKDPEGLYVTDEPVKPSKYPDKIKPEDDQSFSTKLPEKEKPEGYESTKYPISSHHPESVFEKTPDGTEFSNSETPRPINEDKYPEAFRPTEKHPDESEVSKKPYNSIKYPETQTEDGEKPYSTDYPEVTEVTKHPEGAEPQKSEDEVSTNELFGITKKPISSSDGVPTDEFSTEFSALKPGIGYLPQGGELPNEKIPSSEHLNENATPVISEHSSSTKIDSTDPAAGSLSTLHQFGSHQDKPPSVDLTHELGSSFLSQDLITKYSEHTTAPSDIHESDRFSSKPSDEEKPTELEINAPTIVDDYPGRPKPIVPGEGLHKVQDPSSDFVESSSFPSKTSEIRRPEVSAGLDIQKHTDFTHNSTSNEEHPEGILTVKPEDYYTTPGKHKASTLKQPNEGNIESTDRPGNENTDLEEAFNTESATEHVTYDNYVEGTTVPAESFTRKPAQDSISFDESLTDISQGIHLPEKVLSGAFTGVQKTTTPSDYDLINKLHNIISGIQSQVTDGKTTKQPYGSYELTSSGLPIETPQDYYLVTDKFGRPAQKPQEFVKLPYDHTPESLGAPSRHPVEGIFSSENEIYDQTTIDLKETENQTDEPQFGYTSVLSQSTEHFVTSKGPEGIHPTEVDDGFSNKYPQQETATEFPDTVVGKPESTEFPEPEKPQDVKHPEFPTKDANTSYPDQSSSTPKHPTDELLVTGKTKPETSIPTEFPEKSVKPEDKYSEETTVQFFHKPSASVSTSFSQYSEDSSTTASSFQDSGKTDSIKGNQITAETPTETSSTTATYPYTQNRTTQIYQEIKGNQTPLENADNLIAESNKTAPHNEDHLHEMVPQDINQKHPTLIATDKPLHVVYPTYYPDGVVTRTPGSKPYGETDKKVTVTPQNTIHEDTTIKNIESNVTTTSKFGETYTIHEASTEISKESSTTSPVVIIQEVHTEVHSERAPIKTDSEGFIQKTTTPTGDSKPELNKGESYDHRPELSFEKFTKQPEFTSQTPQIIFGQPAVIQPTGSQSTPENQTSQPHITNVEMEKFSTSTRAEYPAKQPESSTKPGYVTITPIGIVPVTKGTENIMHLYSPKDKHPISASSIQYPQSFTTASPAYSESIKHTTEKGETVSLTEIQTNFVTDQDVETTNIPEVSETQMPFKKTTQKPTDGVPAFQEGTSATPTQGIEEEYEVPHALHPGATKRPPFDILTEGLPSQDKTSEMAEFTTTKEGITQGSQGVSFVPYKLINGNKVYYPEKESPERPAPESTTFDGYDRIPYEIVNGTKFFYPNRVVTSRPEAAPPTTPSTTMGMYVPYKIVNGSKIYYTQDKTEKPEKFDGLDYLPFEIINGTKIFYPERVTTTPSPSLAMYVPFKIIDGTKVYYTKEAQEEPQNIPDEYDGFDYVPYNIVNGNKVFRPDHISGNVAATTEHLPAMYVPYKLLNGKRVYYPKDAQTKPQFVPEEYDGFDLVPYEVVNGTKLFYPDSGTTQAPEQTTPKTSAMFVPYKVINGTKVYFPKYAQSKPMHIPQGYDGFDYLPYEDVNGTKVFRPERVTSKPDFTTSAFYSNGMFVPYKIINNTKVFFPKDAQHKPRPLKAGYDGVQYLSYDVINGTKVFYPERITTPTPILPSALYVPYKLINGTKVYYADKATENPEKIPEGFEGFDYMPYEVVNGNKLFFYPDKLTSTKGMYVPYKKVNGSKVYYPKDSSEKRQPIPEGYDGADYIPYEIINGTKVFYPDRITTSQPAPTMYVPYKMVNGTKVYYPKEAQQKPYLVIEGYDGFDSLPYEIVNGTNVFHFEDVTQRPTSTYSQGMFVPYKMVNGTKVYYPQEAHKRPHPLSDEYAGLDYVPYEIVNGTKVFHPEHLTPGTVPAMYVPYKLINGTKVFYPKHAQQNPQQIPSEYDGFDYVPYEIINGSQVFYPSRIPNYQGMYVPYKIINGEKVFYPKYAQHKPPEVLGEYDGFDYLPYENVNGTNIIKPAETVTKTPSEQSMYVPYKVVNGTKVFYAEYAQYKPHLIPQGFDGFDYIPYEIVNGTKVFDPDLVATPGTSYKPAMYVPFKIIDGKKVYYPKHAQNKPHLVPEGYDGFDYIPYEFVNGTKIFDLEHSIAPGSDIKPSLYVPYKIMNGIKVYQPKYAQHKPLNLPQDYDGFDYLSYDVVNGNKVFYPEKSVPLKQAMYVPFKDVNGTKVFYPKYAQHVPIQIPEDYDGFEYIPYEIVNGNKVFHPEQAIAMETPFRKALYVPYKVLNGTKVYYPKNSHYNPYLIPQGYDGFDYIPYEMVNGNKIFHPEQAIMPETSFKEAMYVPFRIINETKVYYPKHAQTKPQLTLEKYDGFDYLPYEIVNGMKVFDPQAPSRPTYLQGMYVPYKSINNTKVFYPKDAHNKPNFIPEGYDGADYVPYEALNNTKMFYPELISTAQPGKHGSAGVYVPFKVVNNKKVFYPKEATPFPPTVRYPYDGVAFVPHKMLGETSPSEIIYVDDNETFKPHQPLLQPGQVPGEGSCYINNMTFANNTEIPPMSPCQASCICVSSVVRCVRVKCPSSPENKLDCSPVYREGSCCPTYVCGDSNYEYSTTTGYPEIKVPGFAGNVSSGQGVDATTPFVGYGTQKRPSYESGDVTVGKKPETQAPSEEYHLHKPPKPKPEHESLEPYDSVEGQLTPDEDYDVEDEEPYGPGTCRYAGKVYVSAQQIPRDDPCDFCFCFRSDIICLQQSCPPPIPGCRDEPIQGFCCPRYECHVKMATMVNVTSTTTTTTTTLPPHFFPHAFKGSATKTGCFVQGRAYRVGQAIPSASGPCMDCICGGNGRMKCEPKVCTPEPMIRKMISPSENVTSPSNER